MPHTQKAFDTMDSLASFFRESTKPKSMLYVGWRHDCKPWWHDSFAKDLGIERLGVIEIFPKNIADLEQLVWSGRYDCVVHGGDVREIEKYIKPGSYDIIFWDHGPEHVAKEELSSTTSKLLNHASKMVIYCCPWGSWPQGAEDGNENEVHRSSIEPNDLIDGFGFQVVTCGSAGQSGAGEIVAFKMLSQAVL